MGLFPGVLLATVIPATAIAQPIASSSFVGAESPLSENGAWEALPSLAPQGTRFQKNNGAYPDRIVGPDNNHAGARTTALIPPDHYSEIVVGHLGNNRNNVGPIVRVQASGASIDSHYLWWGSLMNGVNNLYRIDSNGTTFTALPLLPGTSPVTDGDTLRLIARGQVIYGIKNGVRDFIYNTGPDTPKYSTGTAGMLAFPTGPSLTDAMIASWSSGAAPVSSGTWASSNFAGIENPLDEGDRWYPLPGYSGFRKAGVLAIGLNSGHNASGVWSIAPPAKQYSEVTLGTAVSGGGGPVVRIDRTDPGQTGWLLFLWADNPTQSGIYKLNPNGTFTSVYTFAATIVPGDRWRLTADGNTLTASRNGAFQFSYTTDGSYPTGDVGIHALTSAFTFMGWEGGDTAGGAPAIASFAPASGPVGTSVLISGTNFTGTTAVTFNSVSASFMVGSDTTMQATVPAGATTGPLSVTTPRGTMSSTDNFTVVSPPTIGSFAPSSGPAAISVTINGTNFTGATSVTFNAVSASFTVTSATEIQATVPAGAATGLLSVTTPGGTATSSGVFAVVDPPTITSFAPTSGPVGTSVTISGTNFTGATSVTFNSVSASFSVTSATAIRATVPAGVTTGPMSVTTAGGTAISSSAFTVVSLPTITGFSPTSGSVGTSVTISGTNFTGATSVTFNTVGASFTVTSAAEIQATVPAGATTGLLSVTTPLGTARSTSNFTVTVTVTLTAAKAGTGSGSVTSNSNPASLNQINCGATCSASYESGTLVTLTATPATGSSFTSWSGCDTVSGATCTVTMNAARSVTATFTVQKFTLTVQKTRLQTGNGTVTSSSNPPSANQISCGPNCSWSYKYGTVVTLTAKPDPLSLFNSWSDCDSFSGTTCTVTIRSARSVTASFLP
jgi:hypothetical protein